MREFGHDPYSKPGQALAGLWPFFNYTGGVKRRIRRSGGEIEGGKGCDDLLGFEGDGDDLADQAEDVLRIFFAVGGR